MIFIRNIPASILLAVALLAPYLGGFASLLEGSCAMSCCKKAQCCHKAQSGPQWSASSPCDSDCGQSPALSGVWATTVGDGVWASARHGSNGYATLLRIDSLVATEVEFALFERPPPAFYF